MLPFFVPTLVAQVTPPQLPDRRAVHVLPPHSVRTQSILNKLSMNLCGPQLASVFADGVMLTVSEKCRMITHHANPRLRPISISFEESVAEAPNNPSPRSSDSETYLHTRRNLGTGYEVKRRRGTTLETLCGHGWYRDLWRSYGSSRKMFLPKMRTAIRLGSKRDWEISM